MMKSTKMTIVGMIVVLCMGLTACKTANSSDNSNDYSDISDKKYSVVCTIFPGYDWTREIIGDMFDEYKLTFLLSSGLDIHNYQPTAADMAEIATCDLLIYVGGESDAWVDDALKEAANSNMKTINLLECLGDSVKEEEIVEGMQDEKEGAIAGNLSDNIKKDIEGCENEPEYDEHVWLSLKNAELFSNAICDALCSIDSDNSEKYRLNADNYIDELSDLDNRYESFVDGASVDTLLFGDRFPFRYLTDDYTINYYAAFVGCSAETEASFETITFLAGKMDELTLKHVIVLENSDEKIAKTIIDNTKAKDQDILILDSMQSTSENDINNGVTYLSTMENNLEVLKHALN